MATQTEDKTLATNGATKSSDQRLTDHVVTLRASLQNAQTEKQKAMEVFHQWAGAESILQNLLAQLEA